MIIGEHGIGNIVSGTICSRQITGVALATVNVGTGSIHIVLIVGCTLTTDKMGAPRKHFT